jgi:spore coat polysaccharide biosynthesis protein SpsF
MAQTPSEEFHCVAVIQARRGSSRFPDKILKPLGGKPVLQWVIERCHMIEGVERVVCAIPEDPYNDPIADVALSAGASVCRGSESDVLGRYMKAVADIDTRYVMRITSDCPLLDPSLCADIMREVRDRELPYGVTGSWPNGLSCEVFTKSALVEADKGATHLFDREHVTLWIKRQFKENCFVLQGDRKTADENRWVLDYPEDYDFLTALVPYLLHQSDATKWQSVLDVVTRHPEIAEINRHLIAEWREKTNQIYAETAT